jgi:sterol desaturase/sphingolipid hydroxylase (fatty acid hydroxylase superfamily)
MSPVDSPSLARRGPIATVIDYAIVPGLIGGATLGASFLLGRGVPGVVVTIVAVGVMTGVAGVLERVRPERAESVPFDQPLWMEAAHFLLSFELGYGIALGACELTRMGLGAIVTLPRWPAHWPMAAQLVAGVLLYEGTSYWQHRFIHRFPWFWRFHALHHSGGRLNLVRAIRFHAVDIGTAAFVAYVPLVLLSASDELFTLMGVFLSALGVLQHANIRVRTPAWADLLVCTPAVHRHHHSRDLAESNHNFGNTVMLFDLLFGTYGRPRPGGPVAMGIEEDPVPRDLRGQILGPFRRKPA